MIHMVLAALVGVALIAVGAGVVRGRDHRAGIALVVAGSIDVGLSIARSVIFFGVGVHQELAFARDDIAFVDAARASADTSDRFGHAAVGAGLVVWTLVVFAIVRLARPAAHSTRGDGSSGA